MSKLLAAIAKAKAIEKNLGIAAEDLLPVFEISETILARGTKRPLRAVIDSRYNWCNLDMSVYNIPCATSPNGEQAWHIFLAKQLSLVTTKGAKEFFLNHPQHFLGWLGWHTSTRYFHELYFYPCQLCCNCGQTILRQSTVFALEACANCWTEDMKYIKTKGQDIFLASRINGLLLEIEHEDKDILFKVETGTWPAPKI